MVAIFLHPTPNTNRQQLWLKHTGKHFFKITLTRFGGYAPTKLHAQMRHNPDIIDLYYCSFMHLKKVFTSAAVVVARGVSFINSFSNTAMSNPYPVVFYEPLFIRLPFFCEVYIITFYYFFLAFSWDRHCNKNGLNTREPFSALMELLGELRISNRTLEYVFAIKNC